MKRTSLAVLVVVALCAPAAASTSRDCLSSETRSLLSKLESRFGQVKLAKTCVRGARMPSGRPSQHAFGRAFDFHVPRGVDQRDVMRWLQSNSPGVTISYRGRLAGIVHTDTGPFKMTIYRAASHEAGERAAEIWIARGQEAATLASLPKPKDPLPAQTPRPPQMEIIRDDDFAFNIFERFVRSLFVRVQPQVRLTCADGTPMPENLQRLVMDAAEYFNATASLNSAYRPPAYNRRVGGARNSEHMQCTPTRGAVDFSVAGVSPHRLAAWIKQRRVAYRVNTIITYSTHTHADLRPRQQLVQFHSSKKVRRVRYASAR